MTEKRRKLFRRNAPGNYMPDGKEGCIVTAAFIGAALLVLIVGEFASRWMLSPWPSIISWGLFVLILIRFVLFAKRLS